MKRLRPRLCERITAATSCIRVGLRAEITIHR